MCRGKCGRSAAEVGEEPNEEGKSDAEDETGDDGKIERGVFAVVDDVAGKPAETKRKFAAEIKQRADDGEERSQDEKGAAEFAKRIHDNIIEESGPSSASERQPANVRLRMGPWPAPWEIRKNSLQNIYH